MVRKTKPLKEVKTTKIKPIKRKEICGNCKHCFIQGDGQQCRKRPPKAILNPIVGGVQGFFPGVNKDWWCDEWAPLNDLAVS